jgi:hypothetical protein
MSRLLKDIFNSLRRRDDSSDSEEDASPMSGRSRTNSEGSSDSSGAGPAITQCHTIPLKTRRWTVVRGAESHVHAADPLGRIEPDPRCGAPLCFLRCAVWNMTHGQIASVFGEAFLYNLVVRGGGGVPRATRGGHTHPLHPTHPDTSPNHLLRPNSLPPLWVQNMTLFLPLHILTTTCRSGHVAVVDHGGNCMYVYGGFAKKSMPWNPEPQDVTFEELWRFHLITQRWEQLETGGPKPTTTCSQSAVVVGMLLQHVCSWECVK